MRIGKGRILLFPLAGHGPTEPFSEKLWSWMLHISDPLLTLICNKLLVREYVTNKVGGEYLIHLLWSGVELEDIPLMIYHLSLS